MSDFERIGKVLRYISAHALAQPDLAELARVAGLSESHFHRMFRRYAGTTPKSFLQHLTAAAAREKLIHSWDVLSVAHEVGLSGPGRLHDLMVGVEAMSPGEIKRKGEGLTISFGFGPTPFGRALLGWTERGICWLSFVEPGLSHERRSVAEFKRGAPFARFEHTDAKAVPRLGEVFSSGHSSSLLLSGSPFQLKVWQALMRVPPGSLITYGELASLSGAPGAARAVGTAMAKNSVAYLIPCHRVIRESGAFGQYRWGKERKLALHAWEASTRKSQSS